jgi:hypothetical protein
MVVGSEDVMIAIAFMMFVGFLGLVVAALAISRSVTLDYEKRRARLHQPGAETLVYDVPHGRDPVQVTTALALAGFATVEDIEEGARRVLVDCPHGRGTDRTRVRAVIEQVNSSAPSGPGQVADTVRFLDER